MIFSDLENVIVTAQFTDCEVNTHTYTQTNVLTFLFCSV